MLDAYSPVRAALWRPSRHLIRLRLATRGYAAAPGCPNAAEYFARLGELPSPASVRSIFRICMYEVLVGPCRFLRPGRTCLDLPRPSCMAKLMPACPLSRQGEAGAGRRATRLQAASSLPHPPSRRKSTTCLLFWLHLW